MTDEMQQYVCKNCNAALNVSNAVGGVVKCEYCESVFVLPKPELSEKARITLVSAENALDTCDFESAYTLFQKAMELDPTEPQSFFGAALAKHKVQYLKDTVNNRLQPICHEMTRAKFCDDKNYKTALDLATPEQKAEYEQKASEIDYIKDKFIEQDKNGVDYDCFICVKVTDKETLTRDYKKASELYLNLQKKGYNPFFSEFSMSDLVGEDYEAVILYALYKSKCMLVVCGNEDYLETPWVKNEYTRFIELMTEEQKERNSIAIAYFNKPIEQLPGLRGKLQGVDLNNLSAVEQICGFIDNCDPEKKAHVKKIEQERAAAQDKQKAEEIARIKAEAERKAQEAATQAQEAAERAAKLEEEMNRMREMLAAKEQASPQVVPNVQETSMSNFVIKDGAITKYKGTGGDVVIPRGITSIGNSAFCDCKSLTRVTIPDSVTSIGEWAFYGCESLTSVTIPNSVTNIGKSAFYGCGFTSVTIPDSVTSIDYAAFRDCKSLTSVTIPDSVTTIGKEAFCDCKSLTRVTIPDSVTSIGNGAFYECSSLTSITIPGSVKSIGEGAFSECGSLTSVTIPNSVTSIGKNAFQYCTSLTSVTIPNSITSIGESAFFECPSLTSITIPDSVTSIGEYAFYDCRSLTSVTIPNSVKCISNETFYGCESLKSVTIPNSVTSIGDSAFGDCRSLTSVTIPNSVKCISNETFYGCESLTSVTIPDSVTSIGEYAFGNCESLTSVTIPDSVTSIGNGAFGGCESLTSVTIPDSVTSIGERAFFSCSSLRSVTIPNSVTRINDRAFENCSKDLVITCRRKKPLFGMPKGFAEGWNGIARVVWKK